MTALVSCGENEQEIPSSAVPQSVMSAFQAKYPNETLEVWSKGKEKGKTVYKATFRKEDQKFKADFDESGNFIEDDKK